MDPVDPSSSRASGETVRWVANLDAESAWARLVRSRAAPPESPAEPVGAGRRPRPAALEAAAAFGTLLRALARPGDRLWTVAPVAPERLPPVPGIARVELETGPPRRLDPLRVRPWAWAPPWQNQAPPADAEPTAEICARVNDRRFSLDLAQRLGVADPLARPVRSLVELLEHLRGPARGVRRWVVKARFSAAGRDRYHHRPAPASSERKNTPALDMLPRLKNLFHQHGTLIFEPWHQRVLDLGLLFEVRADGTRARAASGGGLHRLHVDERGQFRGIELDPAAEWLEKSDRRRLEAVADEVARALGAEGYRGPVSLDLWLHRDTDGSVRLHALGEINARLSFGWLARAWARKLGQQRGRLVLGREPEGSQNRPLLHPDDRGRGGAWWTPLGDPASGSFDP